jgi:signal transduction histidine kinase
MTLKLDASYNAQPYGSLRELNAEGEIKAAVDADLLQAIMKEYLHLLETSAAVYEKNGDYAAGIFSSGWCRQLDQASRSLCDTDSNQEALRCGKWLCHESCWQTSRTSIEAAAPAELRCHGGLRIYAIPIFAGSDVVGSINFGFGSPPKDPEELNSIAVKYAVPEATLVDLANEYHPRSEEVILEAKSRLHRAAKLIGEIVHRNRMEKSLIESLKEKEELILRAHREKEAAEEAKQVAILANKAKSAFLANMSHEIRTPLSAIQGFLELISMEITENPRLLEYIGIVDRNCSYLAQLIDDILDISRVESGNIAIHKEVVNVIALIKEVLAILGEKARSKGLKLSFVPSPRMPKKILSNGIRLRQILINIIGNAVKFTDQGHVEVSCELEFVNQPESRFLTKIKVKDTGRGIADEDRAKLFKPFGQLHAEDSELHEGARL